MTEPDDPADALLEAVSSALPVWVERVVAERYVQWSHRSAPPAVLEDARRAGQDARAAVEPPLRDLLATDVDAQRTNPLSIIRTAVRFPTAVLAGAGVPPVERDQHAVRLFPDDHYDLSPAAFADLGDTVHEPGVVWGAAKAHLVLRRRTRGASP